MSPLPRRQGCRILLLPQTPPLRARFDLGLLVAGLDVGQAGISSMKMPDKLSDYFIGYQTYSSTGLKSFYWAKRIYLCATYDHENLA
jgi:hypothetical protein